MPSSQPTSSVREWRTWYHAPRYKGMKYRSWAYAGNLLRSVAILLVIVFVLAVCLQVYYEIGLTKFLAGMTAGVIISMAWNLLFLTIRACSKRHLTCHLAIAMDAVILPVTLVTLGAGFVATVPRKAMQNSNSNLNQLQRIAIAGLSVLVALHLAVVFFDICCRKKCRNGLAQQRRQAGRPNCQLLSLYTVLPQPRQHPTRNQSNTQSDGRQMMTQVKSSEEVTSEGIRSESIADTLPSYRADHSSRPPSYRSRE